MVTGISLFKASIRYNLTPSENIDDLKMIYNFIAYDPILRDKTIEGRNLLTTKGKLAFKSFKVDNFPAIAPAGTFSKRNDASILKESGFIQLDYDNLELDELYTVKSILKDIDSVGLFFVSPSGKGIKILVRVDFNKDNYKQVYGAVASKFDSYLKLKHDKQCYNISRLTFLCYDPNCFLNENVKPIVVEIKKETSLLNDYTTTKKKERNVCQNDKSRSGVDCGVVMGIIKKTLIFSKQNNLNVIQSKENAHKCVFAWMKTEKWISSTDRYKNDTFEAAWDAVIMGMD